MTHQRPKKTQSQLKARRRNLSITGLKRHPNLLPRRSLLMMVVKASKDLARKYQNLIQM